MSRFKLILWAIFPLLIALAAKEMPYEWTLFKMKWSDVNPDPLTQIQDLCRIPPFISQKNLKCEAVRIFWELGVIRVIVLFFRLLLRLKKQHSGTIWKHLSCPWVTVTGDRCWVTRSVGEAGILQVIFRIVPHALKTFATKSFENSGITSSFRMTQKVSSPQSAHSFARRAKRSMHFASGRMVWLNVMSFSNWRFKNRARKQRWEGNLKACKKSENAKKWEII